MTPPLACFPVCSTFLALGLVAGVFVLAGWHRRLDAPAPDPTDPPAETNRPFPLWLFLALPAAVLILTFLAGWLGPDW
ncbi:MAG: hypothetical protein K2X87_12585 [Gemmataceae bacterium]|nr:hypothetical protein [Gemmataceae bacterium]